MTVMTRIYSLTVWFSLLIVSLGTNMALSQPTSRSGFPADPESLRNLRRFPCGGTVLLDEYFSDDTLPAEWKVFDFDNLSPNNNILFMVPHKGWQSVIDFKDSLNRVFASPSWYQGTVGKSNDYLISPKVFIPENTCLSWYAYSQDKFFPESYEIRVSTTTPDTAGFLANPPVFTVSAEGDAFTYRTASLDAYGGQEVYIAFRHTSEDQFILVLDDIRMAQTQQRDIAMFYVDEVSADSGDEVVISGAIINLGLDTLAFDTILKPLIVHYQIDAESIKNDTIWRVFKLLPNDTIQFAHDSIWTPTEDAVYKFRVWASGFGTDDNVENDTVSRWQGIGTRTAIDPQTPGWKVSIYPNPAENQVFIDFGGTLTGEYSVSVYDLFGREKIAPQKMLATSRQVLQLPQLSAGVYLIRIYDREGKGLTYKLVKRND
ncbi:MAG: choice-of-anchor J domain-containing protein [Bacteroidia bacterium]|nr:choice-of-anchor J domain-containing protein [Bacteroidia bacterium]